MAGFAAAAVATSGVAAAAAYPEWLKNTGFVWPVFAGVGALVWFLLRREMRRFRADIVNEVKQSTRPIQPDANGGKSLPDLHRKVDAALRGQERLERRLDEHMENHSR